jgi:anti-sigma factor RsiW
MSEYMSFPYSPDDHPSWEALMPFYLARTLPDYQARALEAHLSTCAACRQALEDWRAIANATHQVATQRAQQMPPLSSSLRQQIYREANQRRQPQHNQLPQLRVMPRQADVSPTGPSTPINPAAKVPTTQRRSSPWLTRIAAVFVYIVATGIVLTFGRDTLRTLTGDPTQQVVVLNTAAQTVTPISSLAIETTVEATQQTEQSQTVQPSATPWNTVMPIGHSPTPTFTITPQPTVEVTTEAVNPIDTIQPTRIAATSLTAPFIAASPTPTRDRSAVLDLTVLPTLDDTVPAIQQFSVVPNTVQPGQMLTVRWQTSGADYIEIAADYAAAGSFEVVEVSDVSTDSISLTLPQDVKNQVVFELRLYDVEESATPEVITMTDAGSATSTLLPMPVAVSSQVSVAIQCPYIYLLYGNQCPDDSVTQLSGKVQRFEYGWILRRNDLGEGVVLFDNGTVSTNLPAQALPQTNPSAGMLTPDPSLMPFYQTALGWAQAPAKDVVLHVSMADDAAMNSINDESQLFAVQLFEASTGQAVLSIELEWQGSTSVGNFSQWRNVF